MKIFSKIVKYEKPFTIFVKTFILDVWQGFEYASELASKVTDVSFLNQFEFQFKGNSWPSKTNQKETASRTFKIVEQKCC